MGDAYTFTPGSEGEYRYRLERCKEISLAKIISDLDHLASYTSESVTESTVMQVRLELCRLDNLINGQGDVE